MNDAPRFPEVRDRLVQLSRYGLDRETSSAELDALVVLAAHVCDAPIALITLLDGETLWTVSRHGWDLRDAPMETSICAHAIRGHGLLMVPDMTQDERFRDGPFVTGEPRLRFYAGAPLTTAAGVAIGTLCVFDRHARDLTERQQTALTSLSHQVMAHFELSRLSRQVAASEARYRTLSEAAPFAILVQRDGCIVYANRSAAELFGAPAADALLGRAFLELCFPADRAKVLRVPRPASTDASVADVRFARCDGSLFWGEVEGVEIDFDGSPALQLVVRDVSAQKQMLLDLERSRELLERTGQLAKIGGWELDLATLKITWSRETFRIAEIDPIAEPDLPGGINLFAPEAQEAIARAIDEATNTGKSYDLELPVITAKGNRIWVRTQGFATMRDGKATVLRGTFQDITERKQEEVRRQLLDEKLQEAQKLESLGVLAGGIAHDFNNILTGIVGHASLAQLELPADSPAQADLEAIHVASERAADLCRQMLAYAGKGHFLTTRLSLSALVEESARLIHLATSKQSTIRLHLAKDMPAIEGDPSQLRQVVMNLVINASEALGTDGGTVDVRTGVASLTSESAEQARFVPPVPPGDYAYVEVQDTGSGMDPDTQAKVFEPFFSTKFTGRGLGLAAVQGIVRRHHGALFLDSEVGRGTTFRVLFPLAEGESARVAPPPLPSAWRGQGRALVVDDEADVRHVVGRMLGRMGFESTLASDGLEAVAVYRENPGAFDIVLLDLTMPNMDGSRAFALLREINPRARILLMSGYSREKTLATFKDRQVSGFLQKPVDYDALVELVRTTIAAPPP